MRTIVKLPNGNGKKIKISNPSKFQKVVQKIFKARRKNSVSGNIKKGELYAKKQLKKTPKGLIYEPGLTWEREARL